MTYSEIRKDLRTGDIVLFRGRGFFSGLICWVCSIFSGKPTQYSHVGMIVKEAGRIMLLESTTLNGKNGVQMNLFSTVLKSYNGKVWVRHLRRKMFAFEIYALEKFITDNIGKPYEKHVWELMAASTPWHIFKGNNKDFFCSELVVKIYQLWKMITTDIDAKEFSPQDFALGGAIDSNLRLSEQAACLSKEIELTR